MKIGYCCINKTLAEQGVSTNSHIRKKNFTIEKVSKIALSNVRNLKKIIEWNKQNGIDLFRISSQLFPFADHKDIGYSIFNLPDSKEIVDILKSCNFGRLTMHPDAFVCLASSKEDIVDKSIKNIEMHREIGEAIGLKDFVINIHVGGMYNQNPKDVSARFINSFKRLSQQAQKWLTIENDDKQSLWSPNKLHRYIYQEIGVPIVLDFHHHRILNDGESQQDIFDLIKSTWTTVPLTHYSEGKTKELDRAHSDMINNLPSVIGEYDIEIEAKGKELAILNYYEKKNKCA